MAGAPETLTLKTHRDQEGLQWRAWLRRVLLALLGLLLVAALLNAFGQRPATTSAAAARAHLTVYAPTRARSGVVYAARFRIDAVRELRNATLVLAPGWAEQYTVNGLSPQPETQGSSDGRLVFGFGHIRAGGHVTFWLSLQVNPTNVGHRNQDVVLADGDTPITSIKRTITIYP